LQLILSQCTTQGKNAFNNEETKGMLHKTYTVELHSALGYLATWLPTSELQLGDLVAAGDSGLTRVGHVRDHGLSFTPRPGSSRAIYEYASSGAVSIIAKIAGQVVPGSSLADADAGLVVKFSRANAIVFEASGCSCAGIVDLASLGRAIEKRYAAGKWDRNWMLVTELVNANAATIIIAGSQSAQADLKASGTIGKGVIRLSDLDAKLEAKNTVDIGFKIIASTGLTPLYRASGIKRSWFGSGQFRPRSREPDGAEAVAFADLAPDDFLH
jgi:hypothetical protein